MSIGADAVWEIRSASGSSTNGGGFDPTVTSPGTDYSQQNSAQIAFTDLVIGGTATQATSVGNPFGSTHVGNFVQITSGTGFTLGIYCILSVSSVTATFDRALGTPASTGGHGNLGGALVSTVAAYAFAVAGNTFWCKGSETITSTFAITFGEDHNGPATRPLNFNGYTTTRGDGGRYTITCATNSVILVTATSANGVIWNNFKFVHTATTRGHGTSFKTQNTCIRWKWKNCVWDGCNRAFNSDWATDWNTDLAVLDNCEIKNSISHAIYMNANLFAKDCYIHDNGGDGVNTTAGGPSGNLVFVDCAFRANANGINQAAFPVNVILVGTVCDANTGDGWKIDPSTGDSYGSYALNCSFTNNGGYGVNSINAHQEYQEGGNNFFYNNTTANRSANWKALPGDVIGSANPYNSASTGDFSLNNTAGGGAAMKGAGRQIVIPLP